MVSSLTDICLCSITDSIDSETVKDVHRFVAPKFRQRLLNTVLARRKIDNPIWIRELSSPEYLRGLTSFKTQSKNENRVEYLALDTQRGHKNDDEYLNRVADSLGSIGAEVEKLALKLYIEGEWGKNVLNHNGVVRLINRCPNLKSLDLCWQDDDDNETSDERSSAFFGPILNRVESLRECQSVLENLEYLSLNGRWKESILIADYPIIDFKRLTSLRLMNCQVDGKQWSELLKFVQNSLADLHLTDLIVEFEEDVETGISYLPIPLPTLKSLKIDEGSFRLTSSFVDNLRQCSKLEYIYLNLEQYGQALLWIAEDEKYLKSLNRLNVKIEVKVLVSESEADDSEITESDFRFKMVSIFNEKITHLDLDVCLWNCQIVNALENVVDTCRNLISVKFVPIDDEICHQGTNANSALTRLFGDRERAAKLRELELGNDIDYGTLMLIFENCTNLDSLKIHKNAHFRDEHLIRWADRGARPSKLCMNHCDNFGDEGLISILVNSGNRFKSLIIRGSEERFTDRAWRILIDHCPNVEKVRGMPVHLRELASLKCIHTEDFPW